MENTFNCNLYHHFIKEKVQKNIKKKTTKKIVFITH
jgi:hypothetical protein